MSTRKKTRTYSNKERLTFVTVSARPQNIPILSRSIEEQKKWWSGDIKWEIIFDIKDDSLLDKTIAKHLNKRSDWISYKFLYNPANKTSGGNHGKDIIIKEIKEGWIYQLDDDNDLYPRFLEKISKIIESNKNCNLVCFWQHNRYKPSSMHEMRVGSCDTAMYFFHKDICRGISYPLHYGGDGDFLVAIKNNSLTCSHLEQDVLCWYNKLKSEQHLTESVKNKIKKIDKYIISGNLKKIATKHNCDKQSRHNYCEVYEEIFKKYINKNISLLEIGVFQGSSMRIWKEWLPKADITGVDIKLPTTSIDGVKLVQADSQTIDICQKLHYKKFDIIIDDGDHHPYSQIKTIWNCWPLLKEGGIYVIEDIQNLDEWGCHWDFIGGDINIFDQRKNGGTYDSVIIRIKKSTKK